MKTQNEPRKSSETSETAKIQRSGSPFRTRFGENSQFLPLFGASFSCYVFQGFVFHHPYAILCEFRLVLRSFRQSFIPSGSLGCGVQELIRGPGQELTRGPQHLVKNGLVLLGRQSTLQRGSQSETGIGGVKTYRALEGLGTRPESCPRKASTTFDPQIEDFPLNLCRKGSI